MIRVILGTAMLISSFPLIENESNITMLAGLLVALSGLFLINSKINEFDEDDK
jgi:hypothetical protein|tara:strand:+ start:2956 stop:3114 length:159 start_codon:yes stop_codon:yes gene_type:complete